MDRCIGRRNITEILLKMALNTIQSINLALNVYRGSPLNIENIVEQDTPVLPQVVELGHAPDKIQVWKTTKGTN